MSIKYIPGSVTYRHLCIDFSDYLCLSHQAFIGTGSEDLKLWLDVPNAGRERTVSETTCGYCRRPLSTHLII
ncbi:hypothetical protein BDP27DRAFT_1313105 [Rhodocollybia butyracea]|uniref:Uncharacterized protein n=1 Tax=Rhodocollybia butyracea TaxID=206335 RepID=A0A9P5QAZ2_9AGAR|nr:hypothetical protein BDP27DRAFT_1313105 [Rhodocollybia butyracea]